MTVTKQPAVYTHTCDRCKATATSDDGTAPVQWVFLGVRDKPSVDLCGDCSALFDAFMKRVPHFCQLGDCDNPPEVHVERRVIETGKRETKAVCASHALELLEQGWASGVKP